MKLTAIRGIDPAVLRDGIAAVLEEQALDGVVEIRGRGVYLVDVRLREVVQNYLRYHNPHSRNWYAEREECGPVVAYNYRVNTSHVPRRGRFLQWRHWAHLDNEINHLLDDLGVSATFGSAYGNLRKGLEWTWICPMEYTV